MCIFLQLIYVLLRNSVWRIVLRNVYLPLLDSLVVHILVVSLLVQYHVSICSCWSMFLSYMTLRHINYQYKFIGIFQNLSLNLDPCIFTVSFNIYYYVICCKLLLHLGIKWYYLYPLIYHGYHMYSIFISHKKNCV